MQQKLTKLLICFVAGSLLLAASRQLPQVVNYPKPNLQLDTAAFRRAGCTIERDDTVTCPWESPVADLGCSRLNKPSDLLAGLNPQLPLIQCRITSTRSQPNPRDYFYRTGGLLPNYIRYVVYKDGKFVLVKNQDEFKRIFAPIESANEALSYALAVKNLQAYYGQQANPDYEYFVDKIEDTHVVKNREGYSLNLYEKKVFGCGAHPISVVNVVVTPEGDVREVSRKEVYKNPDEDNLCVD